MTDSRLSFTARAIILLLGLSLLVMLGVTVKERISNPHLVTERPAAPQGMGQEQSLLASLMQKVAAEPTNKDALMHLAEHLMATQEWDAAATFAQRAVALDVNDPQPLYMLGVILHNQGKPQEAAATLEKVVVLRDDATVRYSLGVLYSYFLQQKDKGRAHWEAGLKDPKISPEMRQAIEEGFILDVLQNYTTYDTFYQLNKEIEEDPRCKTADAKRQIARFVELHETNIAQRVEVIVEHFRTTVMPELGGMAKAMVITASRQGAVKYRQAFENYTQKKGYTDIKALVAFSGKVKLPDDDTEYSEASINGFPEDRLTKEFDKDEYQVLLVANKYQTGFDQPKLCAMYVLKKLKGVSAVQTLSRLNRICPPFEKKTFVLDFVNTYEDIKAAFAPYYTTTLLSASVTPTAIYDLEAQIDAYTVLDLDDIEKANELLYKGNISSKDKQKLTFYFKRAKNRIEQYELIKQHEIVSMMRHFVRFYEFLLQVSCFEDTDLHKKYNFITYLLAYINIKHPGGGYNLDGKIKATNFVQKKSEEHTTPNLVAQPVVKLPTAESFGLTEAKEERLSQIIAEINSRTGKAYDNDVAVKAMLQIRDILLKSDKLKTSARNNTVKDFEFSYFDDIDDALIEGLEQNQDFFSLLLSNDEIKRQVLGIFTDEIYKSLREA